MTRVSWERIPSSERDREVTTAWLRRFAGEFWCEHEPELWNALQPLMATIEEEPEWWHWKFDLTFRDHPKTARSIRTAPGADIRVRDWARRISAIAKRHTLLAYVIAQTEGDLRPHVHGVLSFPPGLALDPAIGLDAWNAGGGYNGERSRVERYDQSRGIVHYGLLHGGFEPPKVGCPRWAGCKRGNCPASTFPWRPGDATLFTGRSRDWVSRYGPRT